MNNEDIRFNILYHLNINDLENLCFVDHLSKQICSSSYFWKLYFDKNNVPFKMIKNITRVRGWINEYKIQTFYKHIENLNSTSDFNIDYGDEENLWNNF